MEWYWAPIIAIVIAVLVYLLVFYKTPLPENSFSQEFFCLNCRNHQWALIEKGTVFSGRGQHILDITGTNLECSKCGVANRFVVF